MGKRRFGSVLAVAVGVLVLWLVVRVGHQAGPASARPSASASLSPAPSPSASPPGSPSPSASYDPAQFAVPVRRYAAAAGVSPHLLMAILYNESYKPHDPALERAWQKLKPDSAFGVANMHRAAFDETKQGRDFAARSWEELPDDPDLAVEAAAWYLHDLARQLPAHWSGPYTKDELLALGYNAGPGNMLAFARGATPGATSAAYLDQLHQNWPKSGQVVGG